MKKHYGRYIAFLCAAAVASLSACEMVIPVKEMADAKAAISLASQYQSGKYAKEEFDAAQKALLDSHEYIKTDKDKEAKASAEESKKKAEEALAKALPLLAKETLDGAKAALSEAEALFAPEFAKEKYDAAALLVKDADAKYTSSEFIPSYETALLAKDAAAAARADVLAQIPLLKGRLAEIRDGAAEVKGVKGGQYAEGAISSLDAKIAEAETALTAENVKAASAAVREAGDLLKQAQNEILKGSVLAKIKSADESLAKIKESPFAGDFAPQTSAIQTAIADAGAMVLAGSFGDADMKADEALKLIDALTIELEKKAEADRIAQAALAEKSRNEAAAEPAAAEEPKAVEEAKAEEARDYVVIYNPKSADCLWKIADKMYKNAKLWPLIYMANRAMIKDPDLIYPGQKFKIPPVPKKGAKDGKADPALQPKAEEAKAAATGDTEPPSDAAPAGAAQ
ncbi:MAG: hypothetical protein ACRCUT_07635 [Spirochaetota bacterium]